jgi:L-lactate dehydrogenase complex protein LldG
MNCDMTERENILGRIREALQVKAPLPGLHAGGQSNGRSHSLGSAHPATEPPVAHARDWLPAVGNIREEQFALFAQNCADLKANFQRLASREELKATLIKLREAEKWQRLASHEGALTRFACQALGLPTMFTDQGYDVQALEKCDVGITECDGLIAQTGGVVVTSRSTGGRALSVLPPHHVVIARQEQLLPDLPAAFAWLQQQYAPDFPSMISFITGPSRTGDIERIMVLGAHGPKKLTILCV